MATMGKRQGRARERRRRDGNGKEKLESLEGRVGGLDGRGSRYATEMQGRMEVVVGRQDGQEAGGCAGWRMRRLAGRQERKEAG